MKIAYFLSHPVQYFSPLLRQLAAAPGIELIVYYGHDSGRFKQLDKGFGKVVEWDVPLLDGYSSVFLRNLARPASLNNQFWNLINPGIIGALQKDKTEIVIVHGWSYFTNFIAIVAARLLGKKVWLRGENPYPQEIIKPRWLIILKRLVLQYGLFKLVDNFLYIGTGNKDFYTFYGVKEKAMTYCPYAVDNFFFQSQAKLLLTKKNELKKKYCVPDGGVVILFSGKFISKKRPVDLLRAFAKLKSINVTLMMVGEGELRNDLERLREELDLKNVFLTGFVNQSEISNYYALADVFVLPSGVGETWGLVVNEAMNFHLPVVVSTAVGSAVDLVRQGENGFIYPEGDVEELAKYLRVLVDDESLRQRFGNCSAQRIEQFSYEVIVKNILDKVAH